MPKSRIEFWEAKFAANVKRDTRQVDELEAAGWTVMTLWECETRDQASIDRFVYDVVSLVNHR